MSFFYIFLCFHEETECPKSRGKLTGFVQVVNPCRSVHWWGSRGASHSSALGERCSAEMKTSQGSLADPCVWGTGFSVSCGILTPGPHNSLDSVVSPHCCAPRACLWIRLHGISENGGKQALYHRELCIWEQKQRLVLSFYCIATEAVVVKVQMWPADFLYK